LAELSGLFGGKYFTAEEIVCPAFFMSFALHMTIFRREKVKNC
jgi:hypothetical protein